MPVKNEGNQGFGIISAIKSLAFADDINLTEAGKKISTQNMGLINQIMTLCKQLAGVEETPVTEADKGNDAVTKTENGKNFPASAYAYTPDKTKPSTWKLRIWADPSGGPDSSIVGAAVAAVGKGFRGNKVEIPEADMGTVKTKLRKAWKKANPDKMADEIPEAIKESAVDIKESSYYPGTMEAVQDSISKALNDKNVQGFCGCSNVPERSDRDWSTLSLRATGLDGTCLVRCYHCDGLWLANYVKDDQGNIVFSNIKPAQEISQIIVASESDHGAGGDDEEISIEESAVALRESAAIDENGIIQDACIIQPGWGSSGYYSAAMLAKEAAKFAKAQMFVDHPTAAEEAQRPEGTLTRLAGVVAGTPVFKESGWKGPGLYGPVKVFSDHRESLTEKAPYIGLSINASGMARPGTVDGRSGRIVESFTKVRSVDFVTLAGAGGALMPLLESAREQSAAKSKINLSSLTLERLREARPDLFGAIEVEIKESEKKELNQLDEKELTALKESLQEKDTVIKEQSKKLAKLEEKEMLREAERVVTKLVEAAKLPNVTKKRLRHDCIETPLTEAGELDTKKLTESVNAIIAQEIADFAEISGSGRVSGMGGSAEPASIKESVGKEMDEMLGVKPKEEPDKK